MKQAILIIAHKNIDQLNKFINCFDENFNIYIHLDKKSFSPKENLHRLFPQKNVKTVYAKYIVNWGGYNILRCTLFLLDVALKDKENTYFHLFSGQDYPIKKTSAFFKYINTNQNKEFLDYHLVPYLKWEGGSLLRYRLFYPLDVFDIKSEKGIYWIGKFVSIQKKMRINRTILNYFPQIYGGSNWFSLSLKCVTYVIDYTKKNPSFFRRLRFTFAPEETYLHTVIMNSPFRENVNNNNLREIQWMKKNNSIPAIMDEKDFETLLTSNNFFARKIDMKYSSKLVALIDKSLL